VVADETPSAPPLQVFDVEAEKPLNAGPRLDKGKGKATEADLTASPPPLSPSLPQLAVTISEPEPEKIILGGLPFTPPQISALLKRAESEMELRPKTFPLLGEYKDCFTGEQFFNWLLENVPEFQKELDIVLKAARDLTEHQDLLRRVGQFGNEFERADDAYYQIRPKVPFVLCMTMQAS
jgi:hypothetical protein